MFAFNVLFCCIFPELFMPGFVYLGDIETPLCVTVYKVEFAFNVPKYMLAWGKKIKRVLHFIFRVYPLLQGANGKWSLSSTAHENWQTHRSTLHSVLLGGRGKM